MGDMEYRLQALGVPKIERSYNPEGDMPHFPCPQVSWVEYDLLQMVLALAIRIDELEARIRDSETAFTKHRCVVHGDKG